MVLDEENVDESVAENGEDKSFKDIIEENVTESGNTIGSGNNAGNSTDTSDVTETPEVEAPTEAPEVIENKESPSAPEKVSSEVGTMFPLPKCPKDGFDMAPVFGNPFNVKQVTSMKCVKCGYTTRSM